MRNSWKKWLSYLAEGAFLIWGMSIMSLYFYYYPSYGFSFIWAIQIVLIAAIIVAILAGMIFMALSVGEFWEIGAKQKSRVAGWIKAAIKKESIGVPFLFFPVFIYACSFIWILYIYKRSRDLSIVANDTYALIIITILAIIAFSLGSRILKLFKFKFSDWLERFLLSEAIGLGTLMMIMYALGMAHLYYCSVAYGLVGLIAIFTYREIFELWNFVKNNKVTWRTQPLMSFKNFLIVAIALMGGIYTAGMFQQYPTGWDGLHTYASLPNAYEKAHSIVDFPYWLYSGFPQNGEMLFILGFLLGNFTSVPAITFLFMLLSGLAVYHLGQKFLSDKVGLTALFLFLFLPTNSYLNLYDNKIDHILLFYALSALSCLVYFISHKCYGYMIISAVFMGIASGLKYNFFPILLPSFLLVLLSAKSMGLGIKIKHSFIIVSIILVLFSPWAAKNYLFSGNPIEPLAGDYLSRDTTFYKQISPTSYRDNFEGVFDDANLWFEDQDLKDWKYYLTLPYRLTFNTGKHNMSDMNNPAPFFILSLPLILFYLFYKKEQAKKQIYFLLVFVVGGLIFWFTFTHFLLWYAFPMLAVSCVLLAGLIQSFACAKNSKLIKLFLFSAMIAFSLSYAMMQIFVRIEYPPLYVKSSQSQWDLVNISNFINENIDDGIIWCANFPPHYFINNPQSKLVFDQYLFSFSYLLNTKDNKSASENFKDRNVKYFLYKSFKQENYSYLMENALMYRSVSPLTSKKFFGNQMNFIKFRKHNLILVKNVGEYYLYKFK